MRIVKQHVLDLLAGGSSTADDRVERAEHELPAELDTDDVGHRELLHRFDVDLDQLKTSTKGTGASQAS
jgi:hypothetical protein